jgi:hypothetical protein
LSVERSRNLWSFIRQVSTPLNQQEFLRRVFYPIFTKSLQMVFAEATSVIPLLASDAYHRGFWKKRTRRNFSKLFK